MYMHFYNAYCAHHNLTPHSQPFTPPVPAFSIIKERLSHCSYSEDYIHFASLTALVITLPLTPPVPAFSIIRDRLSHYSYSADYIHFIPPTAFVITLRLIPPVQAFSIIRDRLSHCSYSEDYIFYPAYCICYNMAPHHTCAYFQHDKARLADRIYFHHPCCVCDDAKNKCPVV